MLKSTSQDKVTLNSEKIRPVALAVNELCLSEGIRLLVNSIELKKKLNFIAICWKHLGSH